MSSANPPVVPTTPPTPAPTSTAVPAPSPPAPSPPSTTIQPPAPTPDPGPNPTNTPNPTDTATTTTTRKGRPSNSTKVTSASNGIDPAPSNNPDDIGDGTTEKKSIVGPVVGGIAGVLVFAFLVAVFVMRYKKKNRARKRRLEFLGDHESGNGSGNPAAPPAPTQSASGASPAAVNRPLEMTAINSGAGAAAAAAAHHRPNNHNDGYDYQQGYQQVSYGGYPEQQDQYDPYYAQRQQQQQQQQYQQQQYQQQGYYPDQQGYYPDENQYQNQYAAPVPFSHASQATGSPSMTHATASPKSYPQPPLSNTTGGRSSPHTPLQSVPAPPVPDMSYDKNTKIESGYVGVQSTARNPQLVPQSDEGIKVPV